MHKDTETMSKLLPLFNAATALATTAALVWLYMSVNNHSTHVYQLEQSAVNIAGDEEP